MKKKGIDLAPDLGAKFFPVVVLWTATQCASTADTPQGYLIPAQARLVDLSRAVDDTRPHAMQGTWIDVPDQGQAGEAALATLAPARCIGPLVVIDWTRESLANQGAELCVPDLERWEERNGTIPEGAFVLLYTGWAARWETPELYWNQGPEGRATRPGLDPAAVERLVRRNRVQGIGIDAPSLSVGSLLKDESLAAALEGGALALRNLAHLEKVLAHRGAVLILAPTPLPGSSTLCRVLAAVPREG